MSCQECWLGLPNLPSCSMVQCRSGDKTVCSMLVRPMLFALIMILLVLYIYFRPDPEELHQCQERARCLEKELLQYK